MPKQSKDAIVLEKEYLHKSGKRIPVLVAVTRIEHTDTCIGFVLDISERKALDRRKDEFISMASHELKTPVTSLKGFLTLLQRRLTVQGDEKALHYLARMDTQVNKLTKLIAKEHQNKIFERFYQATDSNENTYPGLGIGLYISCEIVKRHGGQLWVESEKGGGATFHFTLPLYQVETTPR